MWYKYPAIIVAFFILAVVQNSFLASLSIMAKVPNLIFILFFLLIFFKAQQDFNFGFVVAVVGGFFLDIFMPSYFGVSMVVITILYFLVFAIMHFLEKGMGKSQIYYFIALFIGAILFYNAALYASSLILNFQYSFSFDVGLVLSILYNTAIACGGFYLFKIFMKKEESENQLKLL